MSEIAIGIDLGTSNSCVAIREGDSTKVLANAYGERTTASVVFFQEGGSISVGNAARAGLVHDPARTIASAKRLIGRFFGSEEVKKAQSICSYKIAEGDNHGVVIEVGDEQFTLPEISAMVLREMKTVAEAQIGQPVSKAVITVPAYFNDNQRQATKDAGRIAGLEVLRILNEPTAAALSYGFGRGLTQKVAVWDLGGGTFDISVLEIGDDVFEVLATCGDTFLGGDDFDDRVIDLLADEFQTEHNIGLRNDPFALEKLKVAAEGAKKALSTEEEVEIRIPDVIAGPDGQPLSIERSLSIDEYSKLVHDLIQRTFGVCDAALSQAGVIARDLDGVILVGGPTRLPLIRDAVREYFQQEPKSDVDPDEVVAMGAAIHAASLVNPMRDDAFLLDVTPLSLRIGVAGGLAESVIERNTPVPIEQTRRFTTFKDYQESVDIRVYQGESRDVQENELLGQFIFSGFEKARRGDVSIDITFEINADGIVDVKAKDLSTGKQASTRITLSAGLSEGDIDNIIETGRTERVVSADDEKTAGEQSEAPVESLAQPDEIGEMPEDLSVSDEDLILDGGILDEAVLDAGALGDEAMDDGTLGEGTLDEEALDDGTPAEGTLEAATEIISEPPQQPAVTVEPEPVAIVEPEPVVTVEPEPVAIVEPEPVDADPALRPIEIDDLITDEIEIPPALMDDDLLPESDDLLELEGLEDVKLTPAAIEPPPGGKITAIDEDLTTTAPTIVESEAEELEEDFFERPGTDLSASDDKKKA
ncbi:MAG: Hsp70 family protein [Deltaproteobacteria bacterium]|nr:Hsp70 family protein [Deltaproteobacteria bacterium]